MVKGDTNGNGFLSKFQGIATIAAVLFGMISPVTWLGYSSLSDRIGKIESSRFTSSEFEQYKMRIDVQIKAKASHDAVTGDIRRIYDRFNEFKDRTEKTFTERRDDIGVLRKELGGSANLRDALADLKKTQDEQQRQILGLISIGKSKAD